MVARETDLVRLETMAVADRLRWKEAKVLFRRKLMIARQRIESFLLILLALLENTIDLHQSATRAP